MKKRQTDKAKNMDSAFIDAKLRAMAKDGAFDDAMEESLDRLIQEAEPTKLTYSELSRFHNTVRKASHEKAIMQARKLVSIGGLPLGRYLQSVRDKCDLTKADIAKLLNKDRAYVDKIENGQTNPLNLLAKNVADIMQLFRLTVTELVTTIEEYLNLSEVKPIKASAMGRSSIEDGSAKKSDALSLAMDATLLAINKKKGKKQSDKTKIDHRYIEDVKKALTDRGETDLLV